MLTVQLDAASGSKFVIMTENRERITYPEVSDGRSKSASGEGTRLCSRCVGTADQYLPGGQRGRPAPAREGRAAPTLATPRRLTRPFGGSTLAVSPTPSRLVLNGWDDQVPSKGPGSRRGPCHAQPSGSRQLRSSIRDSATAPSPNGMVMESSCSQSAMSPRLGSRPSAAQAR